MTTETISPETLLRTYEAYLYDGLYTYWAEVWDEASASIKKIGFGTGYDGAPAEFRKLPATGSATEENRAKALAFQRAVELDRAVESVVRESQRNATAVGYGDRVRVVSGRKVAKGTEGIVFWMELEGYMKLGIALTGEQTNGRFTNVAWTYLKNVEVVNPAQYILTPEQARAKITGVAS